MAEKGSTVRSVVLTLAALLLVGSPTGCGGGSGSGAAPAGAPAVVAGAIAPAEARALIASDSTLLVLDVRSPGEWNDRFGHLEGSIQIPIDQLARRLGEIEPWKGRTVITVCTVGQRSDIAARLLAAKGFRDARNLSGGLQAWRAAGY